MSLLPASLSALPAWRPLLPAALGLAGISWLASGVMMVQSGQVALVERFGAITRTVDAGIHLRLPWPVERDGRLNLTEQRRLDTPSRRVLTGDTNLVQMALVVQFKVRDAVAFTTATAEPERVITSEVLAAATRSAAAMSVDDLLTSGRAELQRRVLEEAQAHLDRFDSGVELVAVEIRELNPPETVVDAFNDVSSARGDRETLSLSAEAWVSKTLPEVRGRASQRLESARTRASRATARARGEASRVESLQAAWREDPAGTREDLRAEALRAVAPRVDVVVAPVGAEILLPGPKGGGR
jgi:membrane protease subunit HflK